MLLTEASEGEAGLEWEQAGVAVDSWAPLCVLTRNHTAPPDPGASWTEADKHAPPCQTPGWAWNVLKTGSSAKRGLL